MNHLIRAGVAGLASRVPFANVLASRRPVILLYHGISNSGVSTLSRADFIRHILFLKQHAVFIGADQLHQRRRLTEQPRVLLTFDDGFRNHVDVVAPILRDHGIPAMFFVSSRHATPGKYLWFSYLSALEYRFPEEQFTFRGRRLSMAPSERELSVRQLKEMLLSMKPHPESMYRAMEEELPQLEAFVTPEELADSYAGMTAEQLALLSADPLFTIGVHTVDHPFLTMCEPDAARRQVQENRDWIETVCNVRCRAIAYPSGNYDADVLSLCRNEGFRQGYSIQSRIDHRSPLELPRLGIYSQSTDVLGLKVRWGNYMRTARLPVG